MLLTLAAVVLAAAILINGGSPLDWAMTRDALEAFRWLLPIMAASGATLLIVFVTRLSAVFEFQQFVMGRQPDFIKERIRDLEADRSELRTRLEYVEDRNNELNGLVRGAETRTAQLIDFLRSIASENEIARIRKAAGE